MKYLLAFLGGLTAILGTVISFYLLMSGKFSGGEFVAFTLGIIIVGIAIGLVSDISELSIAGNVIKLRQVKEEAEKNIESLKKTQKSFLKYQLASCKRLPGGIGASGIPKDPRIDDFWFVYSAVVEANLDKVLAKDIYEAADYIARGQIFIIQDFSENLYTITGSPYAVGFELPNKSQLYIWATEEQSVAEAANKLKKQLDETKVLLFESLEEYGKILDITKRYSDA